jgi:hypothetical protein
MKSRESSQGFLKAWYEGMYDLKSHRFYEAPVGRLSSWYKGMCLLLGLGSNVDKYSAQYFLEQAAREGVKQAYYMLSKFDNLSEERQDLLEKGAQLTCHLSIMALISQRSKLFEKEYLAYKNNAFWDALHLQAVTYEQTLSELKQAGQQNCDEYHATLDNAWRFFNLGVALNHAKALRLRGELLCQYSQDLTLCQRGLSSLREYYEDNLHELKKMRGKYYYLSIPSLFEIDESHQEDIKALAQFHYYLLVNKYDKLRPLILNNPFVLDYFIYYEVKKISLDGRGVDLLDAIASYARGKMSNEKYSQMMLAYCHKIQVTGIPFNHLELTVKRNQLYGDCIGDINGLLLPLEDYDKALDVFVSLWNNEKLSRDFLDKKTKNVYIGLNIAYLAVRHYLKYQRGSRLREVNMVLLDIVTNGRYSLCVSDKLNSGENSIQLTTSLINKFTTRESLSYEDKQCFRQYLKQLPLSEPLGHFDALRKKAFSLDALESIVKFCQLQEKKALPYFEGIKQTAQRLVKAIEKKEIKAIERLTKRLRMAAGKNFGSQVSLFFSLPLNITQLNFLQAIRDTENGTLCALSAMQTTTSLLTEDNNENRQDTPLSTLFTKLYNSSSKVTRTLEYAENSASIYAT